MSENSKGLINEEEEKQENYAGIFFEKLKKHKKEPKKKPRKNNTFFNWLKIYKKIQKMSKRKKGGNFQK